MITPVRIRVRNIRSVADGEIIIPPTGITALHGPVGSGKSTFLSAMVWALYGEVRGGLKQADIRRTGADREPCEAEVEFAFNGQTFTALRGLKQRSQRGTVREEAYARWWTNGATGLASAERQISPSKLTQKITELTGLSGRAYTGAFFIAQGELTSLAEGTPAQVQQLFEEQTGLSPLTKKVEEKSAEARRAEEKALTLPGSREETDEALAALDAAQKEAAAAHEAHEKASGAEADAAERLEVAEQSVDEVQRRRDLAEQARIDHARAEERVQQYQQRVRTLSDQIAEAGTPETALEELNGQLHGLRVAVSTAEKAIDQAAQADREAIDAEGRAQQVETAAATVADPKLAGRIKTVRLQLTESQQRRGALRGEYTRLNDAIKALHTAVTACCPTCTRPLRDARALIADLKRQLDRCIIQGKNAKAKAEAAEQLHASLQARWEKRTQTCARLEAARTDAATARRRAAAARQAERTHTKMLAEQLSGRAPAGDPQRVLDHARTEIDRLDGAANQAQRAQTLRAQLAEAEESATAAKNHLSQLTTAQPTVDADEVTSALETLHTARNEHARLATAAAETNTRFQVAAERTRVLTEAHAVAKARMRTKAHQLHQAQILHTAAALLAALRLQLLSEYTAAVSQAATDVLTQITDRHVRFEIDSTFIPRVHTAEGTPRPTRVLSGGEKATAALAFRLGITEQITGGTATGMIIADEITAAHDADTRRAVQTCLSELGWPALVVSHGEEITETAQHVISLQQPDEQTGTVVAAA